MVFGAIAISYALAAVAGGPGAVLVGLFGTPEDADRINREYGFDKPFLESFATYLGRAVRGDFGESIHTQTSAIGEVFTAFPYTVSLVAGAIIVVCALAVPLAAYSVLHRDTRLDRMFRSSAIIGQGIPDFWVAILLVLVFAVWLHWLPSFGADGPSSFVLPVLSLSIPLLSTFVRLLRSELLDIMDLEFTAALKAKGLTDREVVWRHAMRNAMAPVITMLAIQLGWLLGGTIVVENVFGWPGIGSLATSAVTARDLPVIQSLVVVVAAWYVLLNLAADLLVLRIDPRVRVGRI